MSNSITKKTTKGFSLIEMIAVVAIIGLSFVGLMALAIQSIQVQRINKNNLVASMLAQEGLEILRNRRDTNWYTLADSWDNVLPDGDWAISYSGSDIDLGAQGLDHAQAALKIDNKGLYSHYGTSDTPYSRMVSIDNPVGGDIATATVAVRYKNGNSFYNYVAETVFYNWNK